MKTMTTNRTLSIALTALLLAGGLGACKPKKDKAKAETVKPPSGETEVNVLCSGPEFFTNDKVFRANNLGESMDQATSKKKALANARADLASAIQTQIKGVIDNYVNSRELNNKEEVAERFEGLTREVIDQKLVGVKTICEKQVVVNATGNYKTYVAIELSAQDLLAAYNERLSKDERLRIDYDYEKFKETFDKEMEKMGK
ncbi:MAG TPA: hypothetical protein PKH36_03890 [Flavobacteriales bacterium]|nr:hypothetical protein [Flavobacteriales bacterium]HNK67843.1 hypothetical protein [Flavobacteriales bacterium]